ncbi:hypothetical protein BN133_819 [Cronobacter dublinensis 582]|nr:hypothetical protein BN133_819 [Cronobacter dublinensis 582]
MQFQHRNNKECAVCHNLNKFRKRAQARLSAPVYGYFGRYFYGTAADE